jgi:hypothetical protein
MSNRALLFEVLLAAGVITSQVCCPDSIDSIDNVNPSRPVTKEFSWSRRPRRSSPPCA